MNKSKLMMFGIPIGIVVIALAFLPTVLTNAQNADENCVPQRFRGQWSSTDFCNISIDLTSVISGGPPRDGIRAIDDPVMETVAEASVWLVEQSPVIAIEIDGEARAYPQAILMRHEIANDEIAGIPVAVTFCPLCNSSIVFERDHNGQVLTFGVSGVLRNSDMVMFDRETESWWQQLTGEGIVGEQNGELLGILPSQVIGFGQFVEQYPDGLVMGRGGNSYGTNPYVGLDDGLPGVVGLYIGEYDQRLPDRSRVLAANIDGVLMAYPFAVLQNEFAINDTLGDTDVVAFWQPGVASSLDTRVIDEGRDIGTVGLFSRTLEDGTVLDFVWDASTNTLRDEQTGSTWNLFGEATDGDLSGTELRQLVGAPHYWFAWAAFHPDTAVYGLDAE